MIKTSFSWIGVPRSPQHEAVCAEIIIKASAILELPDAIEIIFKDFGPRTYGGVDLSSHKRIGLNSTLSLRGLFEILPHELIHVSQRHVGIFNIKGGWYYWHGKPITNKEPELMPPKDYQNLPWELDVNSRLRGVVQHILTK